MVFQSYALYPHMTVYENMAFALKVAKLPKADIDTRVRRAADILRLNAHTNWGLGIVGHCWHEGGYFVVVFYGFLMVVIIRLMDDAMRRHPSYQSRLADTAPGDGTRAAVHQLRSDNRTG